MNIHEAIEHLQSLIDELYADGALFDSEERAASEALAAIAEYVRINEGGTVND